MKITIVFILFLSFTINAQETIVPVENQLTYSYNSNVPVYFKDVNNIFNKFLGVWIYDNGTHYLKITITKNAHQDKSFFGKILDPNFEDELVIRMIYKHNGVEIYNTTPIPPPSALINGNIIRTNNKVELFYAEPTSSCRRQKQATLLLEFVSDGSIAPVGGTPNGTLKWTIKNRLSETSPHEHCPNGTLIDSSEFLIPANLILDRE